MGPQPPSRLGRGNFPERELARAAEAEQYYPGLPSIATLDIGDPSYICSPQSTIIAAVIVVLLLNFSLVAGFVFFYRLKRKHWTKTKEVEELRQPRRQEVPPPLPPHHPRGHAGQDVMFRGHYDKTSGRSSSSRFTDNPTLAGMAAGRHQGHSQ